MNNNDLDNAEIWLRQVVKGGLADKETIKAIEIVLNELGILQMNYALLEERFDGSAEEKVDRLVEKLQEQYQKGYQDGFKQAKFDIEMDKINEGEV